MIESYLDADNQISKENFALWKGKLDVALEYGLKRFIGKELDFHRQIELKKSELVKKYNIDFVDMYIDLLQIKYLSDFEKGVLKIHDEFDNQVITTKTVRQFLNKVMK